MMERRVGLLSEHRVAQGVEQSGDVFVSKVYRI